VSLSSLCVQVCCSLCVMRQQRSCQLLLLDGLRGRRRAEVSLSSLCAQVLLSVWSGAAEAMPAVAAGWLAGGEELRRTRAQVSLSSLCVQACCSLCGLRQPRPCQLLLLDGLQGSRRAEVSWSSLCAQVCCSLCGVRQPWPCQLLLLDGLRGRRRAGVSLSSLCVQVLLYVWNEAAEAMPAVVVGWLAREEKSRGVFVFSLRSSAALCVE